MGKRSTCSSWGRRLLVSLVGILGSTDHSEWRQIQGRGQQRSPRWGWCGGGHGRLGEEEEMVRAPWKMQGAPAPVEGLGVVGQGRGGHRPTLLLARYAREAAVGGARSRCPDGVDDQRWKKGGVDEEDVAGEWELLLPTLNQIGGEFGVCRGRWREVEDEQAAYVRSLAARKWKKGAATG
jgi:hypothetical protein